jgi:uncharacterized protein YhbP (UPF0306 family)
MPDINWSSLLQECLSSTEYMALATTGADGLWNQAVYFAWDDRCQLYFMSMPSSRHMQNIVANGAAAAAVFSTNQAPTKKAVGIQIRGRAKILGGHEAADAHKIYFTRAPIVEGIPHELREFLGPQASWKLVQVTPEEIGYFNSELFGEHRQVVPHGVVL